MLIQPLVEERSHPRHRAMHAWRQHRAVGARAGRERLSTKGGDPGYRGWGSDMP
ncbi:hypothetical protein ACU4GD_39435 [Cupriavidus basilensis]